MNTFHREVSPPPQEEQTKSVPDVENNTADEKLVSSPPLRTPSGPDGIGNETPFKPKSLLKNQFMSMASIKYDIGRKGYLDPHEELSQKRDNVGRGDLSSKEAAALAREILDLQ